ncbi:MAG TPA: endolytic transglycosylase MltG [Bacteroidales bacterium]|nr:endolytic transglycosylase MltG [Bacteroidales bacterium]
MVKKSKKPQALQYIGIFVGIVFIFSFWLAYTVFLKPAISIPQGSETYLFAIPTGSTLSEATQKLSDEIHFESSIGFTFLSKIVSLEQHVYPGLYKLSSGMSNKDLVLLFRSGKRETVNVTIRFGRYAEDIVRAVAPKIEADYNEMLELISNQEFLDSLGFSKETAICLFLPDTYECKWNTSAKGFLLRMHKEFKTYWNEERINKAHSMGFSPQQIMTIASIVNQETNKIDEKPRVAGVYINRLKQNMPLQADPTVKYAIGDFSLKRIYKGHLLVNSPYNTYRNNGLPPGPICTPQKADIEAVLNHESHAYIFFCARPDYSGYHNFAKSYDEHLRFARIYSSWLDSEQIK